MASRFVNLLVKHMSGRGPPFSLLRIKPANLFHPTGSPLPTPEATTIMEDVPLPPATISFEWPSSDGQWISCPSGITHLFPSQHYSLDFMAFGRNRDKIVGVDSIARTFLYDAVSCCITHNTPDMPYGVMKPVYVPVMCDNRPQSVALMHGSNSNWHWQSLPQPPFPIRASQNSAYMVVGDSQIWVSTKADGTYSFDTESGAWRKISDWALPFRGHVEYLPEHNLWIGFSQYDKHLCVSDVTVGATDTVERSCLAKTLDAQVHPPPPSWFLQTLHCQVLPN